MTRTAGWVLLGGAALFCAAAFSPSSFVFGMSDPGARRAHLAKHVRSWPWAQAFFASGAVVSAVGLVVLGLQLDGAAGGGVGLAGLLAVAASVPWAMHCWLRGRDVEGFLAGTLPASHFALYLWGTLAALAITGTSLLDADLADWLPWFVLGATAVFVLALLRFRDLPPFVLYLVTAVVGATAL